MYISEKEQNIQSDFFVFEINVFELIIVNPPYYQENTCHRQEICQQTALRF